VNTRETPGKIAAPFTGCFQDLQVRLLASVIEALLMPDIARCGGISEMRKIANPAGAHNVPLVPRNPNGPVSTRRSFVSTSALMAAPFDLAIHSGRDTSPPSSAAEFSSDQERRRQALFSLLGDLPWQHQPGPVKVVGSESHEGYTLERLVLDLNGIEPVPALLLIPKRLSKPAPGLLYIHWHGGMYNLGKEQLLRGTDVQPPYAPVCAELGLVTLAIDSWCFGERKHDSNGHRGEEDTFKQMLWQGRVLWGMMMFDEYRALSYLASRPEIDAQRLGAFGMSMGSTKAWWLGALDPRVRAVIDICCLTDFDSLIRAHGLSGHGVYYFVPSLLKQFDTADINALIVPRPHLSVNGRRDSLTPPKGVEKIREKLLPLYRAYGREQDCRIELFDCAHEETPEMRRLIIDWMKRYLAEPA
jgi:dienelactone hydrolase